MSEIKEIIKKNYDDMWANNDYHMNKFLTKCDEEIRQRIAKEVEEWFRDSYKKEGYPDYKRTRVYINVLSIIKGGEDE